MCVVFVVVGGFVFGYVFVVVWLNMLLFDVLIDYWLKVLLCIYMFDYVLIGEFGEECCDVVYFKDVFDLLKKVIFVIEDVCFYDYGGVDFIGIICVGFVVLMNGYVL